MPEILVPLLQLPTVLFTALLVPICAYWGFVIMGVVDIEFLDALGGADGALEGAIDGAAEALDGAIDGAAEALDGSLDGVAEGADGAAEALEVIEPSFLAGFFQALKLRSAPVSVVASFMVIYSWLMSLIGQDLLRGLLGGALMIVIVTLGALVVGLLLTSLSIRPLAPLFVSHVGQRRRDFIGSVCTLYTGRVDANFGQAICEDGGAGLQIQVRCDHLNALTRGSEALIVSFDQRRDAYIIEPMEG